MIIEGSCDTVD